tara:strand:+ start:372 stop:956 length:585 start_codon:yes stop_codon:yes gene_type:complete
MHPLRTLAGLFLLSVPVAVPAQTPYTISGLNTDMTLANGVAQAKKLGGLCEGDETRAGRGDDISIQCRYSHCSQSDSASGCEEGGAAGTGLMVFSFPISSITLIAPSEASPLTRIVMAFEGDTDAVAEGLLETFGPTVAEGAPTDKKTWSKARRWGWVQGQYRLGLLNSPQLIILATDPQATPSSAETQPEAPR